MTKLLLLFLNWQEERVLICAKPVTISAFSSLLSFQSMRTLLMKRHIQHSYRFDSERKIIFSKGVEQTNFFNMTIQKLIGMEGIVLDSDVGCKCIQQFECGFDDAESYSRRMERVLGQLAENEVVLPNKATPCGTLFNATATNYCRSTVMQCLVTFAI